MPNQKLLKKLQIKPGYRLLLLDPPADFAERLNPLPEGSVLRLRLVEAGLKPAPTYEYVHLFAKNSAKLTHSIPRQR